MRSLTVAVLVLMGTVTVGVSRADAASFTVIGEFSWDLGFEDLGPTFTFTNTSEGLLANLSLELATDEGLKTFAFNEFTFVDTDNDGAEDSLIANPMISVGSTVQIADNLGGFQISQAFIRQAGVSLFLLDPDLAPLMDGTGASLGLDGGERLSAWVGAAVIPPPPDPTPVPEPGTLVLLGLGAVGALIRSRNR